MVRDRRGAARGGAAALARGDRSRLSAASPSRGARAPVGEWRNCHRGADDVGSSPTRTDGYAVANSRLFPGGTGKVDSASLDEFAIAYISGSHSAASCESDAQRVNARGRSAGTP